MALGSIQPLTEMSIRNISWEEVGKCLLSLSAESFVFQVAIQKFKDEDM